MAMSSGSEPNDDDRKAALAWIRGPFRERTPGKEPDLLQNSLAQLLATTRANAMAEMKERCADKCRSLADLWTEVGHKDTAIHGACSCEHAIRALK